MNVKELKEALEGYPEDMEMEIWMGYDPESGSDYYADFDKLEVTEDGKLTFI